jgi:hypothetical protein
MEATCSDFKDFTELQFIEGNHSILINSLGPNLWISHDWEGAKPGGPGRALANPE